jgi:hypothetical protein
MTIWNKLKRPRKEAAPNDSGYYNQMGQIVDAQQGREKAVAEFDKSAGMLAAARAMAVSRGDTPNALGPGALVPRAMTPNLINVGPASPKAEPESRECIITVKGASIAIDFEPMGEGEYALQFDRFKKDAGGEDAEEQAAGRLHKGMALTDVNSVPLANLSDPEVARYFKMRPCVMKFEDLTPPDDDDDDDMPRPESASKLNYRKQRAGSMLASMMSGDPLEGGNRGPKHLFDANGRCMSVEEDGEILKRPADVPEWDPETWPPVVDLRIPPRLTWFPPISKGPQILNVPFKVRGQREQQEQREQRGQRGQQEQRELREQYHLTPLPHPPPFPPSLPNTHPPLPPLSLTHLSLTHLSHLMPLPTHRQRYERSESSSN